MLTILIALVLVTFTAALVFFHLARRLRERMGIPANARIVYADTGAWKRVERPLFSRRFGLTGKPDYVLDADGATIPVEVKPNRLASSPRDSDVMQLAAYALLVEDTYGAIPPYGLLKYRDAVFRIDFTDDSRTRLLELMDVMRQDLKTRDVTRSHTEDWRCRGCGYRDRCGQSLVREQ
jgi:CRISPR-associated exonuclease Cas4